MTRAQLAQGVTGILQNAGLAQPAFETRCLLMGLFRVDSAALLLSESDQVGEEQQKKALNWAHERGRGVPLAYLTGVKGFYKSEFQVRSGVLIPRPETEHVVETALTRVAEPGAALRVADLGCGTGCIGLSLLREWPQARLDAVDAALVACEVSQSNAAKLQLTDRVNVIHSHVEDWQSQTPYDVIVANPPYIAVGDPAVDKSVHEFEPALALYSGADGLDAIRNWAAWAARNLRTGGLFICEFGAAQALTVEGEIKKLAFVEIQVTKDLSGKERVISAKRAG